MKNQSPGKVREKSGLFAEEDIEEENPAIMPASNVLRVLTRYVTSKHTDEACIKELIEQKKMKEHIFESVFEQFAKGKKL